ncbi:MAG TPA: hypothetical protein PKY20_05035, partial [Methanothrix sp.]|nr:hypothetical protein [Methanothrix sp.]
QTRPISNAAALIFSRLIDRDTMPPIAKITHWTRNPATISGLLRYWEDIYTPKMFINAIIRTMMY